MPANDGRRSYIWLKIPRGEPTPFFNAQRLNRPNAKNTQHKQDLTNHLIFAFCLFLCRWHRSKEEAQRRSPDRRIESDLPGNENWQVYAKCQMSGNAKSTSIKKMGTSPSSSRIMGTSPPIVQRSDTAVSASSIRKNSLLLVWVATAAQLCLDLVTTIVAFLNFIRGGECCGQSIDLGYLPIAIASPYFCLIVVELGMLACSVNKYSLCKEASSHNSIEEQAERSFRKPKLWLMRILGWLVTINPYFGFMVSWARCWLCSSVVLY